MVHNWVIRQFLTIVFLIEHKTNPVYMQSDSAVEISLANEDITLNNCKSRNMYGYSIDALARYQQNCRWNGGKLKISQQIILLI